MTTTTTAQTLAPLRLLLSVSLLLLPLQTSARCASTPTDPREQLPTSNFVFRLQYKPEESPTATLPCPVSVWEPETPSVSTSTGYPLYTIVEIYKQDWTTAMEGETLPQDLLPFQIGDSLAVIYATDTGFQKHIPAYIRDDPEGFVAYLEPYRHCRQGETVYDTLTKENLRTNPFALSQCNRGNRGWSTLEVPEQAFLKERAQEISPSAESSFFASNNSTGNSTNATTEEEDPDPIGVSANQLLSPEDEDLEVSRSSEEEDGVETGGRLIQEIVSSAIQFGKRTWGTLLAVVVVWIVVLV